MKPDMGTVRLAPSFPFRCCMTPL